MKVPVKKIFNIIKDTFARFGFSLAQRLPPQIGQAAGDISDIVKAAGDISDIVKAAAQYLLRFRHGKRRNNISLTLFSVCCAFFVHLLMPFFF